MMSAANVRDKPKAKLDALRPSRPSKMMGRRPTESDNWLHRQEVSACVTKKRDSYETVLPRHLCEWFCTYDDACIITNLTVVSSRDAELADEL